MNIRERDDRLRNVLGIRQQTADADVQGAVEVCDSFDTTAFTGDHLWTAPPAAYVGERCGVTIEDDTSGNGVEIRNATSCLINGVDYAATAWATLDTLGQSIELLCIKDGDGITTHPDWVVSIGGLGSGAGTGGLANVVEDVTPQLGGPLDVNGQKIVSASNGNIDIEPNGTGNVLIGNLTIDADQTVGAGQDNYVLTYDNGTGLMALEAVPTPAGAGGAPGDYAALLVSSNATTTTISASSTNFSNKVQVLVFDTNSTTFSGLTPDHTTDDITVDLDGTYAIHSSISFSGGASATYSFAFFINNGATQVGGRATKTLDASGNVDVVHLVDVATLSAADTIELWVQNETGTEDLTVQDCELVVIAVQNVSGGMTVVASSADANVAATNGQLDAITMSSYTADRTWSLPSSSSLGNRYGVSSVDGNATYEILIKTGTAGSLIDGVDYSTNEYTRLFIAGEQMTFVCVDGSGPKFICEVDGRKPCIVDAYLSTNSASETASTWVAPTSFSGVWTEIIDNGGIFTAGTSIFTPRRNGNYAIHLGAQNAAGINDLGLFGLQMTNGTTIARAIQRSSVASAIMAMSVTRVLATTAGTNWTYQYQSSSGTAGLQSTDRVTYCSIAEQF